MGKFKFDTKQQNSHKNVKAYTKKTKPEKKMQYLRRVFLKYVKTIPVFCSKLRA